MDSTSTPRFRFRDHKQEMAEEESSEGHTTADSSSLSSDGEEEPELQSMTARVRLFACFSCIASFKNSFFNFFDGFRIFLSYHRVFSICVLNFLSSSKNQMRTFRRISFQITLPFLRKLRIFSCCGWNQRFLSN